MQKISDITGNNLMVNLGKYYKLKRKAIRNIKLKRKIIKILHKNPNYLH